MAITPSFIKIPDGATPTLARVLLARGLRAVADGAMCLLLPAWLLAQGYGDAAVGAIVTATLCGSAACTLAIGFVARRFPRRGLLMAAALLMTATGLGFRAEPGFWPLLAIAFAGTFNPSSGDVSVFLPLEQALLAETVSDQGRTAAFGIYSLVGSLGAALGALAMRLPDLLTHGSSGRFSADGVLGAGIVAYAAIGLAALLIYRGLPGPRVEASAPVIPPVPLGPSRGIVYRLAALFSLDAFGGGLVVQSMLVLWLFNRFSLSLADAGTLFFGAGLLTAVSYLVAVWVARRIGLVNTMVFTHLPSSLCLIALPFAPNLAGAVALILVRAFLSQMDVPIRGSYVMAVVTPPERPAAASLTAVPRSLAAALAPLISGLWLGTAVVAWPFALGGGLKILYDLLLLGMFRHVKPPEEGAVR